MLRTRLWMGAILIALAVGVLVLDQRLPPWYPFLFSLLLLLSLGACVELVQLLRMADPADRASRESWSPSLWLAAPTVTLLGTASWSAFLLGVRPWTWIAAMFAAVILVTFLVEMARFVQPGVAIVRMSLTLWIAAYLGLLPCFLAQLRWLENPPGHEGLPRGTLALALAIFVPKAGDIGAYFTGRFLGRHRMSRVLSPKKTWEGAVGATIASVAAAVGINTLGPALPGGLWTAAAFGLTVGTAGLLGDLAESLIKRDCQQKDASQVMPGFGGVLDVVDSIVFAAPVAYGWFQLDLS